MAKHLADTDTNKGRARYAITLAAKARRAGDTPEALAQLRTAAMWRTLAKR